MVDHRAITASEEPVGTKPVFWNRFVRLSGVSNEVFKGCLDGSHTGGRNQIKAKPQIDNGAHNRRCRDFAARPPRFGELNLPYGIGLPKIDARSEPIPIIGAGNEIFSVQEIISDRLVAAVKTEDKRTGKPVQLRSSNSRGVSLGHFAIFVQESLFLQKLSGFLPGRGVLQAELFHRGLEFPQFRLAHIINSTGLGRKDNR
jgi:hypothetical protein